VGYYRGDWKVGYIQRWVEGGIHRTVSERVLLVEEWNIRGLRP
jgi:hypothetical protein